MITAVLQGVTYLQASIDLFKAEHTKHTMLSDSDCSKIAMKERGSFLFLSAHLNI